MSLYLRGVSCYSGDGRHKGNAVEDGAPERNNSVEILSVALAHWRGRRHGGAKGFRRVCRVAQHALSSPADAVQKVCQKLLWSLWNWHCVRFQREVLDFPSFHSHQTNCRQKKSAFADFGSTFFIVLGNILGEQIYDQSPQRCKPSPANEKI